MHITYLTAVAQEHSQKGDRINAILYRQWLPGVWHTNTAQKIPYKGRKNFTSILATLITLNCFPSWKNKSLCVWNVNCFHYSKKCLCAENWSFCSNNVCFYSMSAHDFPSVTTVSLHFNVYVNCFHTHTNVCVITGRSTTSLRQLASRRVASFSSMRPIWKSTMRKSEISWERTSNTS